MEYKRVGKLILLGVVLFSWTALSNDNILVNQNGYFTERSKAAVVVNSDADSFEVRDISGNTAVFTGELKDGGYYSPSEQNTKIADFSELRDTGEYCIEVEGLESSHPFRIGSDVYSDLSKGLLKGFYYLRASMPLEQEYAGKWARAAGHPDTALEYYGSSGTKSSPGGWYDAGDYGKYIVNGGISVSTMMGIYELLGDKIFSDNTINIPESGNNKSDLLDEIKYEMDWFLTMQEDDGGVAHKLGPDEWPGHIMPADDDTKRFISPKSTSASLNFAASCAMAGRIFSSYDPDFAQECINSAEQAWAWAEENPSVEAPDGPEGSGGYGDSDFSDEFFWAGAELYVTTGLEKYLDEVKGRIGSTPMQVSAGWPDVSNLGYFSLSVAEGIDQEIKDRAVDSVTSKADEIVSKVKGNAILSPMGEDDFFWGSSGNAGNYGVTLAYAHFIEKNEEYLNGVVNCADYISGRNPTGYSFITGFGSKTPLHIHHRPSGADGIEEPVPGFVAGGPNPGQQDAVTSEGEVRFEYPSDLPALSYADVEESYASNEIAINWGAPMLFIAAYLQVKNEDVGVSDKMNTGYGLRKERFGVYPQKRLVQFSIP
ncbi:MAG: glycoside hydrolase family 9 protein, partial [Chitinivibrionales bacterium]